MNVVFIIGLFFLCALVIRLLIGGVKYLSLEVSVWLKIWNTLETLGVSYVLYVLINNYYQ